MGEAVVTLDPEAQIAKLAFSNTIRPGRHRLTLDYRGKIEKTPVGLFAVDYDTEDGPRRMLTTQFEVGRRASLRADVGRALRQGDLCA